MSGHFLLYLPGDHALYRDRCNEDQRLGGIFRLMKVPGFENPKAPSADPRRLAPMVVEVDLLTTRIKTVETQAHDSPEHIKQMLAGLLGDGAARLTGQVIAVDGGFTTVRPLVR